MVAAGPVEVDEVALDGLGLHEQAVADRRTVDRDLHAAQQGGRRRSFRFEMGAARGRCVDQR
jgi:hypothetical protein